MINAKRVAIYARVSTNKGQDPETQLLDLRNYAKQRGWSVTGEFVDRGISGTKDSRPQLNLMMDLARKRKVDVVLVWRFDRFARSTVHLLRSLEEFKKLGIDFSSYQENLDTSTSLGQAIFTIVSAVAQLERDIIAERVIAGLRKARSLGKRLGRPTASFDVRKLKQLKADGLSIRSIGKQLRISSATVCRALEALQKPLRKVKDRS